MSKADSGYQAEASTVTPQASCPICYKTHKLAGLLSHLEERLQLSKIEVLVEARGLMPDGALLGSLDLVPMQLLQLAPLAGCGPHLLTLTCHVADTVH